MSRNSLKNNNLTFDADFDDENWDIYDSSAESAPDLAHEGDKTWLFAGNNFLKRENLAVANVDFAKSSRPHILTKRGIRWARLKARTY